LRFKALVSSTVGPDATFTDELYKGYTKMTVNALRVPYFY